MKKYLTQLESIELFRNIEKDKILLLLDCLDSKKVMFKAQSTIFSQGDDVSFVGIVLSGNIQIIKDDFHGNRNIVSNISKNGIFAEAFVCSDIIKMPVSVLATIDSEVLLVNFKKLTSICNSTCDFHSKMIFNMMKILANKNVYQTRKVDILSKRTTREKILAFLYSEYEKNRNNSFEIPLNRQQLADYLFVDRSALSSELSKLRKENIIDFHKNKFEIIIK